MVGDIDILVSKKDFKRCYEFFEKLGYQKEIQILKDLLDITPDLQIKKSYLLLNYTKKYCILNMNIY